jgi:hypothetical protein
MQTTCGVYGHHDIRHTLRSLLLSGLMKPNPLELAGVANDLKGFVGEAVSVRCLLDGR